MSAHRDTPLARTFTRAELTTALAAAGHASVAECLYSRPDPAAGRPALALDFDDPGDLGVLIAVVAALVGPAEAVTFGAALDTGTPGHPGFPAVYGIRGATWRGFALDEHTGEQWADDMQDCSACAAEDHDGPDCLTHARAPWEQPYAVLAEVS